MAKQQFLSKIYTSRSPGTKPKTIQGRNLILYLFFSFLLSVPMKSDVFLFFSWGCKHYPEYELTGCCNHFDCTYTFHLLSIEKLNT